MEEFERHGIRVVSGRDASARALRAPELTSDPGGGSPSLLLRDGEDHARVRGVLREIIAGLEPLPGTLRAGIETVVSGLDPTFDLVRDFARPIAASVTAAVLGLDLDDAFLDRLEATTANLDVSGGTDRAGQAAAFRLAVQLSRTPAGPGGLSTLRAAHAAGRLDDDELMFTPVVLAHAAYENSLNFLACAGLELASAAEVAPGLGPKSELEAGPQPGLRPQPGPGAERASATGLATEPELASGPKLAPRPKLGLEPKPELEAGPQPGPGLRPGPEPRPESRPAPGPGLGPGRAPKPGAGLASEPKPPPGPGPQPGPGPGPGPRSVRELMNAVCPARYVLRFGPAGPVAISLADGLPFGLGRHACPGSGVALAEGEIALGALAEVLSVGCRVGEVRWKAHPVFHGLATAVVTLASGDR
jgi:hypothetical protein